jgi:hypothetical protein
MFFDMEFCLFVAGIEELVYAVGLGDDLVERLVVVDLFDAATTTSDVGFDDL